MMGMMGRGMMRHGVMGMIGSGMTDVPSLSGQYTPYIVDQFNRFASREQRGTEMNRVALALSERNIRAVSEFLSGAP